MFMCTILEYSNNTNPLLIYNIRPRFYQDIFAHSMLLLSIPN